MRQRRWDRSHASIHSSLEDMTSWYWRAANSWKARQGKHKTCASELQWVQYLTLPPLLTLLSVLASPPRNFYLSIFLPSRHFFTLQFFTLPPIFTRRHFLSFRHFLLFRYSWPSRHFWPIDQKQSSYDPETHYEARHKGKKNYYASYLHESSTSQLPIKTCASFW